MLAQVSCVNNARRAPEDAKVKQKMVYASSKDAIKKKLDGLAKELQATELADLEWEHVVEVCSG